MCEVGLRKHEKKSNKTEYETLLKRFLSKERNLINRLQKQKQKEVVVDMEVGVGVG